MRILYVNPFSQAISGPDESLLSLLKRLIPLGVEAHVVLPAPGPQVERYEALGARVHALPLTVLRRQSSLAELSRLLRSGVGSVPGLVSLCRSVRPDVIHTNMEVVLDGLLAARFLGIPHVLHYRGNTLDEPKWIFDVLVRVWSSLSRQVFCISRATSALFVSRGQSGKTEVMYNPVDLEAFSVAVRSDEVRATLGARDGAPLVGTVARLHPRKDLETFLRAAALIHERVPATRFVVVGSAADDEERAYFARLRDLATHLGLDSAMTWAGTRRDIPVVMKALDLFVLTSRHEGFGRVVAEAMAAGCPVVVTDEGALPELVDEDRFGLRARAGDPNAFAEKSVSVLTDAELSRRLAQGGLQRSVDFGDRAVAARVLATYRRLAPAAD